MMRRLALAVLMVWGLASSLAAPIQAQVLGDDTGREHRLAQPARRIVSLLPSLTETVGALGATDRLVGVDRYSNWPPEVARLPQLGGLDDAHIERIVALKPDVVLASTAARSLDRLEALGLTVIRLKSDGHADVRRSLGLVAQVLGVPERAEPLWAQIQHQLRAAAARVPAPLQGQTVYFEIGGGPYAAGAQSFIGETLAQLGLRNVVPAALGPFPKLNPEFVVKARPALVMGVARDVNTLRQRPGWSAIPALQSGRVCAFDSAPYEMLVRPGPRLGEAAALVADCLSRLP